MLMGGPVPAHLIRELPTPQLGMRLLLTMTGPNSTMPFGNLIAGAKQGFSNERDEAALLNRLSDAWAWLRSHGLIGPDPTQSAGWERATAEGQAVAADVGGLTKVWGAERLAGGLDSALGENVRTMFYLGDYESACFAAMKAVEVEVRRAARFDNSLIGVTLMRKAFKPGEGPLADLEAEGGEQVATMELFAGAIGAFKNPSSHRTVHFEDAVEAAEVIQTADLLLRLLRRAERRRSRSVTSGS
jgi:uncharacterized protein (TIGR02391 family)